MRRLLTHAMTVSVLLVSLLAATSSIAFADPGNGAVQGFNDGPIKVSDCTDYGDVTVYYTAQGESHRVCTPSNNCNGELNLRTECFTFSDATGNVLSQTCASDSHNQFHTQGSEVQVIHTSLVSTYTDYFGQTYCETAAYQVANGEVRYFRMDDAC